MVAALTPYSPSLTDPAISSFRAVAWRSHQVFEICAAANVCFVGLGPMVCTVPGAVPPRPHGKRGIARLCWPKLAVIMIFPKLAYSLLILHPLLYMPLHICMTKALSLHTVELQLATWKQQCRAVTHRSSGIYNINPTLTW